MKARDLFAGVGWAMAARELQIEDYGYDNDDAVNAVRIANGLRVSGGDVLEVDGNEGGFTIEIGSPPCERFSSAGHGDGVAAIRHVRESIRLMRHGRLLAARRLLNHFHPKIALVIEPLRVLLENECAQHVVWEQVPSVLPIWEACGQVLRLEGWSVATGIVDAYWYETPQNRRRAVLIGRRDGMLARIPEPTGYVNLGIAFPELPRSWRWRSNYSDSPSLGATAAERGRTTRAMWQPSGTITRKAWNWQTPDCSLVPAPPSHSARIQGFPADMVWPGTIGEQRLVIGNAVPLGMAEALLRAAAL